MKYLQMYIWKLIFLITGITIIVGSLILGMQLSKILTDIKVLQLLMAVLIWIGGSFIVLKPLSILDRLFEERVSLDIKARLNFFLFMTFILISLAVFSSSLYLFKEWLELINDTVHRTLDDYFTIIFPLVLLSASIGTFIGSFKLYRRYKETIEK